MLEMTFEPRVAEDEIEPFLGLPLFRFTENGSYSAAYQMRGRFDGRQVRVMDLGYLSTFPKRVDVKVSYRGLQTVAFLSAGPNLPEFHLAPEVNDWDDLDPLWPRALRLGSPVVEWNRSRRDPTVIYGRDEEAVRRLFTPARLEQLGNLRLDHRMPRRLAAHLSIPRGAVDRRTAPIRPPGGRSGYRAERTGERGERHLEQRAGAGWVAAGREGNLGKTIG